MIVSNTANEDALRMLAHQKWEDEGRPAGRELDHWQWALTQVQKPAVKVTRAKATKKK